MPASGPISQDQAEEHTPQARTATSFDNSSQSSTTSQLSQTALPPFPVGERDTEITPTAAHELTPPSSTSPSVQEDRFDSQESPTPKKTTSNIKADSPVSTEYERAAAPARGRSDSAAGSKRTASGHVKHPSQSGYAYTPHSEHKDPSHTRSSSTASTGSNGNVAEISQHLRTKLKYAMVKVQHGWQSRSLEELESLASASPRSTASNLAHSNHGALDSPKRLIQQRLSRKWSDSSSSESSHSELYNMASPRLSSVPESPAQLRGLAPPADIIAGQRRRPSPNEQNGLGMFQDPQRATRPSAKQRTPSQNAVLEKDAVETLLFMASPNNSSYHLNSQPSQESSLRSSQILSAMTSPLRTQFSQTSVSSPKKVAFSDQHDSTHRRDRSALIEQMLDELPDESEDDLGDGATWNGKRTEDGNLAT